MDFEPTPERRMLVDTIDRYLADRYPIAERNRIAYAEPGWSRAHWQALADLGVIGALFAESSGGFAGSPFDVAAVFGALGRGLAVEPFLGTLLAGRMLAGAGERKLLSDLIAGRTIVLPAHAEPESRYDLEVVSSKAVERGAGWVLNGTKTNVGHAGAADAFLVSARTGAAIGLFAIEAGAKGVERRDYALIDGGRGADLILEDAPARLVASCALSLIEEAQAAGLVALCAEAVAIMDTLRDQTVEYLATRRQFGHPIGQFQALKHRMATVALEIEQARSAATNAAAALESGRIARERAVSAAKFTIGRVGTLVAEEAIQMHGGIGMTWELPLSHYAKRLIMIGHLLGDEDHHLDRYVSLGTESGEDDVH
jgi:alkylation response protein AidB-like acyl-CoA dehydrogenase